MADRVDRWLAKFYLRDRTSSAEQRVLMNEERLRLALRAASIGSWDWDIFIGSVDLG